jgi:hypothetical protein
MARNIMSPHYIIFHVMPFTLLYQVMLKKQCNVATPKKHQKITYQSGVTKLFIEKYI